MPHRLNEFRAKIQFITSSDTPTLIYRAVCKTGMLSNTQYVQHAVAEALSRDLDIPLQDLLDRLPPHRGKAAHPFGPDRKPIPRIPGPTATIQEVR